MQAKFKLPQNHQNSLI